MQKKFKQFIYRLNPNTQIWEDSFRENSKVEKKRSNKQKFEFSRSIFLCKKVMRH